MPDEQQLVEYLRRSYHAVDGLWFMMAEEALDFEGALELDRRVWAVLAKIQARKARELTGCEGNSADDLVACFSLKLTADGHEFRVEQTPDSVRFIIDQCPWLQLLQGSDREHVSLEVANAICPTEGATWCKEFGDEWEYAMPRMMCSGDECCLMAFTKRNSRG